MNKKKSEFYDKQYRKFGRYDTGEVLCTIDYPDGDPEQRFKEILIRLGDAGKFALDMGCGDGGFTLSLSPYYQRVVGIEFSDLFNAASEAKQQSGLENVDFKRQDATHTSFANQTFDVIYSRRGPNPREEIDRLLQFQGHFVFITIGENDARSLKEVFGRGQNFGETASGREKIATSLEARGYQIHVAQDYLYDEFYFDPEALDRFLQGVPIFEDYDSLSDLENLTYYIAANRTARGIRLGRHRVLIHAQKAIQPA